MSEHGSSSLSAPPLLILVLSAVLAGASCSDAPEESGGNAVTDGESDTQSHQSTTPALTMAEPVHHLDTLAREPMVAEHPDGTLFVSGYGSQVTGVDPSSKPQLWSSADRGASWSRVDVGSSPDAAGNSDVDLAIAPDGTLYFAVMGFDRSTGQGTHIAIGASTDLGTHWHWSRVSETRFDDRPWVAVAPDGTAHAIWNDGDGVCHVVSTDRGQSWQEQERIHHAGGSSHLAIGPRGEIAVRIGPLSASGNRHHEGVDLVAVSTDGGRTWQKHDAPGERDWPRSFPDENRIPRWVEPLAWGADGALYHLFTEGDGAVGRVVLARSRDQGVRWTEWVVAEEPRVEEQVLAFFPYLTSNGSDLAATWFVQDGTELTANLAWIEPPDPGSDDDNARPTVARAEPFRPDAWNEGNGDPSRTATPAGEYLPVAFLADGDLAVVSPIQDSARDRWGFTWWRASIER